MKSFNIQKSLLAIAASALAFGFASPAMADSTAPVFTINTNAILATGGTIFDANQMIGSSSELLRTVGNTHTGTGYLQFASFALNTDPVAGTGILEKYKLYALFQVADVLQSGTINTPNSINRVTKLDFQFYADPGVDTTFTRANSSGTGTEASATDVGGNDILLGVGTLVSGVDGFDDHGGAYFNSIETFAVCSGAGTGNVQGMTIPVPACLTAQGSAFFAAPVPFYGIAFDAFNNSTQGLTRNGDIVAITQASGTVDFNRIPEPGSLALLGLGLMGIGATLRRRSV